MYKKMVLVVFVMLLVCQILFKMGFFVKNVIALVNNVPGRVSMSAKYVLMVNIFTKITLVRNVRKNSTM